MQFRRSGMVTMLGTIMCSQVSELANLQICDLLWDFDAACHSDLRWGMAVRHHVVVFLVPSSTSSSRSPAIHASPRPSRPSPLAACHDLPFLLVTLPAPLIAGARGVGCEWEGRRPRGGRRGGVRGAGSFFLFCMVGRRRALSGGADQVLW